MLTLRVYCKDHRRRPIRVGTLSYLSDFQGQLPVGWCPSCGREVFDREQDRCAECRDTKGAN